MPTVLAGLKLRDETRPGHAVTLCRFRASNLTEVCRDVVALIWRNDPASPATPAEASAEQRPKR